MRLIFRELSIGLFLGLFLLSVAGLAGAEDLSSDTRDKIIAEIQELSNSRNSDTAKKLVGMLEEYVSKVENKSEFTVGIFPDGVIALGAMTNDGYVRLKIVEALGKIGDESAIPILIRCLRDPERSISGFPVSMTGQASGKPTYFYRVRDASLKVLKAITRENFDGEWWQWQQWWEKKTTKLTSVQSPSLPEQLLPPGQITAELTAEKILQFSKTKLTDIIDGTATKASFSKSSVFSCKSEGTYSWKIPGRFRLEDKVCYVSGLMSGLSYDELIVCDGIYMWFVTKQPGNNTEDVNRATMKKEKSSVDFVGVNEWGGGNGPFSGDKSMGEFYNLTYVGKGQLNGEEVFILEGILKPQSQLHDAKYVSDSGTGIIIPTTIKMQISVVSGFPLMIEQRLEDGKPMTTVEYKDIRFNTGLKDEFFTYTPSADAKIVDADKMMENWVKTKDEEDSSHKPIRKTTPPQISEVQEVIEIENHEEGLNAAVEVGKSLGYKVFDIPGMDPIHKKNLIIMRFETSLAARAVAPPIIGGVVGAVTGGVVAGAFAAGATEGALKSKDKPEMITLMNHVDGLEISVSRSLSGASGTITEQEARKFLVNFKKMLFEKIRQRTISSVQSATDK